MLHLRLQYASERSNLCRYGSPSCCGQFRRVAIRRNSGSHCPLRKRCLSGNSFAIRSRRSYKLRGPVLRLDRVNLTGNLSGWGDVVQGHDWQEAASNDLA
jgi:hypothetical protein